MCIVWGFDLRMYPDSTGTWIHIDEDYKVVRFEGGSHGHVRGLKYKLIGIGHMH